MVLGIWFLASSAGAKLLPAGFLVHNRPNDEAVLFFLG
jgi:hypothetical protein